MPSSKRERDTERIGDNYNLGQIDNDNHGPSNSRTSQGSQGRIENNRSSDDSQVDRF